MNFKKLKNTWIIANKHYMIPIFLLLIAIDGAIAAGVMFFTLFIWLINKFRARLPIDPGGKREFETIVYKIIDGVELKLDLWRPDEGQPGTATVVFAHGGGWISGSRSQPNNVSWCRFLSANGFSVVSIDYRFAYTHNMEDIIEDFSDSVNFIRNSAEPLGLSRNIILMGLSAGGHLALFHAAFNTFNPNPEIMAGIKGVVAYYSPSDLKDLFSADDKSFFARFGASTALKTLPRFDEDIYERYSPVNYFSERMIPVLAVHGRQDEVVPYNSSVKMVKQLKALGVSCRFLIHKTGGHIFEVKRKDYRTTLILKETVRFMRRLSGGS